MQGHERTTRLDMKSKKYELEYGGQFLKDLKLAKRRGLDLKDLSDVTDLLQEAVTMSLQAITKDIESVILTRTGYLYTKRRKQSEWFHFIVLERILTYSRNKCVTL